MAYRKFSRGLTRGGMFLLTAALIVAIGATPAFAPFIGEPVKESDTENKVNYYYPKIGANAVGSEAIIDKSIATRDLALAVVGTGRLRYGAVTSPKIRDRSILNRDLANNIISSAKLRDGGILNRDLARNIISSSKIRDGAIVNADISANAGISESKISYATKTGYLTIPAAALRPVDSSTTHNGSILSIYATGTGTADFVAPVNLPDGAEVKAVRYEVYDDSAYDSTAYLSRSGASPGAADTMATAASSGSTAVWRTFIDSTVAYPKIDNNSRQYVVSIELRGEAGSDLSAGRVTIEYTHTAP